MDSTVPGPSPFPRGMNPSQMGGNFPPMGPNFVPPQIGNQFNPNMMGARQQVFPITLQNPIDMFQKANQFSRGVYVTGFEKTVTAAMLQQHFKIKPIAGLKLPTSKFSESKGFAFVYYKTPEDADYVKQKLDGSVILLNKIRVTKTVVADHLSKMMFKLKKGDMSKEEVTQVKNRYFNERNLQAEVARIIHPLFNNAGVGNLVEINKITIPCSRYNKTVALDYARGFFYISNIKEASRIVRSQQPETSPESVRKESYELVLSFIAEKLNKNPEFSKYVQAEIYEYANKNRSNVIHIKNIKVEGKEDPAAVAEQLRELIQGQAKQSTIKNCYVGIFNNNQAWANIEFATYEEAVAAYEHFKNNRVKFRNTLIYANLRNVKDLRTVVISTVRDDTTKEKVNEFLTKLAEGSARVDPNDESKGRKYEFASFNILEKKTFYINNDSKSVGLGDNEKPEASWRENNTVPRRVVVHFLNDIKEADLRQLLADIRLLKDNFDQVFFEKDSKSVIRANHQKGHIKDDVYVKHSELNKKNKENQRTGENKARNPKGPRAPGEGPVYNNIARPRNPQRPGPQSKYPMNKGPMPGPIPRPIGQMPAMGTSFVPKMGGIPTPNMAIGGNTKPIPQMGLPQMGMPVGMPVMGMAPQMGGLGGVPMMGGMPIPQMGVPKMGNIGMPVPEKKQ